MLLNERGGNAVSGVNLEDDSGGGRRSPSHRQNCFSSVAVGSEGRRLGEEGLT